MQVVLCIALVMSLPLDSAVRADSPRLEGVVNLNTASPEELGLIPGVGPARIRNILAYRRNHPFRTVEELARIKGIGRKTVRRWRQHLAVSGPSTAQRVVRPEQPFVGPPALPPPAPERAPRPQQQPRRAPAQAARPTLRRGEPAHANFQRAPGNACLPPR
jgi:competence ComEA-like helix-hairpin-helix protein